ncbi:MAG: peptidase [Marine Group I thaumarchaeote]|nr:MAG: peptidase [Marine Group I thaumarchaeote]
MTILVVTSFLPTSAFAQFQSGGVSSDEYPPGTTWYAGEGLKKGDFFSYAMCHVDYKECAKFELDMWIKGDITVGTETKWLAEVAVFDGNKVLVGTMELGKIAPEPTGGSEDLGIYRGAFKSSVAWLSAFATSDGSSGGKGPKAFDAKSWGKIGNIGGEQVVPMAIESLTIKSGTWDTIIVGWKTGGAVSQVWIVDDFPFPVKGATYTHVSEGIPPPEYRFELLKYEENMTSSPFDGIIPTEDTFAAQGCDTNYEKEVSIKKPTTNFDYQIHAFYGPEDPVQGCEMSWIIKFISKYDDTEFLNQVQFDFFTVDDNMKPLRSLAQDDGRPFLYSPSGVYVMDMIVKEDPGTAKYVIWVYGLSPEGIAPSSASDYLEIEVPIFASDGSKPVEKIPSWIKNNAGWWADGTIDDNSFVQGIQFLIKEKIMKIPKTTQGTGVGSDEIPSWIKNNAGWWADGTIDDNSFIQGIQFLIKEGIMKVPQPRQSNTSSGAEPEAWYN